MGKYSIFLPRLGRRSNKFFLASRWNHLLRFWGKLVSLLYHSDHISCSVCDITGMEQTKELWTLSPISQVGPFPGIGVSQFMNERGDGRWRNHRRVQRRKLRNRKARRSSPGYERTDKGSTTLPLSVRRTWSGWGRFDRIDVLCNIRESINKCSFTRFDAWSF